MADRPGTPRGRRLLVLAPFTPRLDAKHGGSRAMAQLLAELSLRHRVAVVHLRGPEEPPLEEILRARCDLVREIHHLHPVGASRLVRQVQVAFSPLVGVPIWAAWWAVPAYARCVREIATVWRPDLVQIEYAIMGQYVAALVDCPALRVLVEYDADTGFTDRTETMAGQIRRMLNPLDRWAWRRYRAAILRQVGAVVVFTERDRAALVPLAGDTPVVPIPLGAALPEQPMNPAGGDAATLLFVGSFAHSPNADAARRLVDDILPRVRAKRPDARLVLVGTHPPADLRRRIGAGIELAESVPDVQPYLDRANLVVVPLRLGGGMRVKVLEALAAGKAVVASRLAVEGLDVQDGLQCCMANTDEEFASSIARLLDDEEQRRRLGTQARAWALEHLSWSRVAEAYDRLYHGLLSG